MLEARSRSYDLPMGGRAVRLVWDECRWICLDTDCLRKSFTEDSDLIEGYLTRRAAKEICPRAGQDGHFVAQVARDFGVGNRHELCPAPQRALCLGSRAHRNHPCARAREARGARCEQGSSHPLRDELRRGCKRPALGCPARAQCRRGRRCHLGERVATRKLLRTDTATGPLAACMVLRLVG